MSWVGSSVGEPSPPATGVLTVCCLPSMGGIPARNSKGERLLLYVGIIDILQSYR